MFIGQHYETLQFTDKMYKVDGAWRRDLLNGYHLTYVWRGPRERSLGAFDPESRLLKRFASIPMLPCIGL